MFEVGSEVVCIKNTDESGNTYDLALHGFYTVRRFEKGMNGLGYDYVAVYKSDYLWGTNHFLSILDCRRLKIEKLKERLCLQSVIK